MMDKSNPPRMPGMDPKGRWDYVEGSAALTWVVPGAESKPWWKHWAAKISAGVTFLASVVAILAYAGIGPFSSTPGAVTVTSEGQWGGITAGTVNVAPPIQQVAPNERARVNVRSARLTTWEAGKPWQASFVLMNTGDAPATIQEMAHALGKDYADAMDALTRKPESREQVLAKNLEYHLQINGDAPVQPEVIDAAARGVVTPHIVGRLSYDDGTGSVRTTLYCFHREASGQLFNCPTHNFAD